MEKKPRRDKGDGSLYFKEGENRWLGSFYDSDGKRHYISGSVGGTKREAKLKLEEAMKQAKEGLLTASSKQTVEDYMLAWIEEAIELRRSTRRTWKMYTKTHIIPGLGRYQLHKLTRERVKAWVKEMVEGGDLEAATIHQIYGIASVAFSDAVEHSILSISPFQKIKLPRIEEKEMQVLDLEQSRAFLSHLAESKHRHEAFFTLLITSGMREGEARGLRWSDIDFNKKTVKIQRTIVYISGEGYFEHEPKTRGSRRTILLTDQALTALEAHRTKQLEHRLSKGSAWIDKDLIFPGPLGNYFSETGVRDSFRRILEGAGLPIIRVHDLRHTAATLLLRNKASLKFVQKLLGHASVQTTMRYLHVLPDMEQEDIRNLNDSLVKRLA